MTSILRVEAMVGESHEFDFGGWLRRARERSGLSLELIARETKVSTSRVRALERNDLSGWPGGVFRRGFVRSYALLVGLDPDEAVSVFGRAFPEEEIAATCRPPAVDSSLRLLLAEDTVGRPILARLAAATVDLLVPGILAAPSVFFGGLPLFWTSLAVAAVAYLTVGTLAFGTTPGARLIHRFTSGPRRRGRRPASKPPAGTRVLTDGPEEAPIEAEVSHAHR